MNGDGRDDLVWAGGSLDAATVHFRLAVATGGYGAEIDTGIAAPNGVGVPLDYDGDGARDALLVSAAGRWQVVLGGANGLGGTVETGITATDGDFRGVDLNGDGLSDLAYTEMVGTSGNLLQVRARYNKPGLGFSGSPVVLYEQGYSAGYDYAEGGEFLGRPGQRIDLDGDGREDLLMNENYSLARISADERMSEPFASAISGAVPADINGDGCTDIAYPHYQGSWRVRFSGCLVSGPYGLEIAGPAYGALRHAIAVIDWNADGKDDLLYGDASSTWKVVQSAGDSLLPAMDTGVAHGSPSTVVVADLDGDGLQDLATRAGPRLSYRLHEGPVPDLLLSVADGFGVATRFDYAVATDPQDPYEILGRRLSPARLAGRAYGRVAPVRERRLWSRLDGSHELRLRRTAQRPDRTWGPWLCATCSDSTCAVPRHGFRRRVPAGPPLCRAQCAPHREAVQRPSGSGDQPRLGDAHSRERVCGAALPVRVLKS